MFQIASLIVSKSAVIQKLKLSFAGFSIQDDGSQGLRMPGGFLTRSDLEEHGRKWRWRGRADERQGPCTVWKAAIRHQIPSRASPLPTTVHRIISVVAPT